MGSVEGEVVLLGWWLSNFGLKVRIALAEKGIEYEYREEDLPHNKSPLLLKLNPVHKKIPVLIHNGKPVCESNIILEYLEDSSKDASPLMPSDPYLRAHARFWANYADTKIYEGARKIWTTKGEELQKASNEFIEYLKVLEGELGEKPYFMGETFGYVDITLMSFYFHFFTFETLGSFSIEKECPKLIEWAKRCLKRESISKSVIDQNKIYEATLEVRKALGL